MVDVFLQARRDGVAANRFFRLSLANSYFRPLLVAGKGHDNAFSIGGY